MELMNTRRVTFGGCGINYKSNFEDCLQHVPSIREVRKVLGSFGIRNWWYLFEPYVEITWLQENTDESFDEMVKREIGNALEERSVYDYKFHAGDGMALAEWYCCSEEEREFGINTYSRSAGIALMFDEYQSAISAGKGLENQYVRRCHVLANQLGMNYKREGVALLKRGALCLLLWWLGHKKAVWFYQKILRQRY
jgi:hypothetical protein